MEPALRAQLCQELLERRESLAWTWYRAILQTGYVPLSPDEIRGYLSEWIEQAVHLLFSEPFEPHQAREIGAGLARLHFTQPEALGETISVLARGFLDGLSGEDAASIQPALIELIQYVTVGFNQQTTKTILAEQEGVRGALISEVAAKEWALRQVRDQLELRVQRRTQQLVKVNEDLLAEIAERRRAEEALNKSREQYRDLVENISDVIYAVDSSGVLNYVSPAIEDMVGYSPEESIGRRIENFVVAEDLPGMLEAMQNVAVGQSVQSEYRTMTRSGEIRWVRASSRVDVEDGQIVGIRGVLTDVTDRRLAEEALRESEARFRLLLENSPYVVSTVNQQGQVQFLSRPPRYIGESKEDVIGHRAFDFAMSEHQVLLQEAVQDAFAHQESTYLEVQVRSIDGSPVWHGLHVTPVLRQGRVESVMFIGRDISEQKELDELKDALVRDVSHELRTPLAKMQMSLDLLLEMIELDQIPRQQVLNLGNQVMRNIQRLLGTVEAILDLSTLEAGVQRLHWEPIEVRELIEDVVKDMAPLAHAHGLELVSEMPTELPTLEGDAERLFRVLINLVDNAIKFSDGGQVVVSVGSMDGEVEVAVKDSGQGIYRENLNRVFERFFQEKARMHGVGVGLSICQAIVEAHGGRIWAESPGRGQGSTFRFTLPLQRKQHGSDQ